MSILKRLVKGDVGKDGGSCNVDGGGGDVGIVHWSNLLRTRSTRIQSPE